MTVHDLIWGIEAAISAGLVTAYAILLWPLVLARERQHDPSHLHPRRGSHNRVHHVTHRLA